MKLSKDQLNQLILVKKDVLDLSEKIHKIIRQILKEFNIDEGSQNEEDIRDYIFGKISKSELKTFLKINNKY